MKRKIPFIATMAVVLTSACIISVRADDAAAATVPEANSVGIIQTDDHSVCFDAEDVKNIRTAVNTNAEILDDVRQKLGITQDTYDPDVSYEAGDTVFINGKIYVCRRPTGGAFREEDWTEYTLQEYISQMGENAAATVEDELRAVSEAVSVPYDELASYQNGDIVMKDGILYLLDDEMDAGVPGESSGWIEVSLSEVVSSLVRRDNFIADCEKQDGRYNEDGSDLYKVTFTKQ